MKHLLFLIVFTLSGCVATGPLFSPAPAPAANSAIVYIYREGGMALQARAAYFYVNDVNVFDLNAEGYSWITLPAGQHKLRQAWAVDMLAKPLNVDLYVKPGETKYISFQTGTCPAGYREICLQWEMREKPPHVGSIEIQNKRFQDNFGAEKLMRQTRKQ